MSSEENTKETEVADLAEELAKVLDENKESEETSEDETEKTVEEASEEEAPAEDPSSVQTQGKITIKETVNVRKSASENGERIGTAYQNENYDLIMEQADGWTKILFNGVVGYVKSEFVEKL